MCLGAGERNRTLDRHITNVLLYQLSYASKFLNLTSLSYCSDILGADYTFLASLAQSASMLGDQPNL